MNHMKEIAHILGVDLYEEFRIKDDSKNILRFIKYRFAEEGLMHYHVFSNCWDFTPYETLLNLLNGKYEIVKLPKPILNEKEKEYLSTIIKPFRNKIEYIIKYLYEYGEYISIIYKVSNDGTLSMIFPSYDEGTTYKAMELGKEYTLEELGL